MCVGIHFSQVDADGGHNGCRNTTYYTTSTHCLCILMSAVHSRYTWHIAIKIHLQIHVNLHALAPLGHQDHDRSNADQPAWCGEHLSQPLVCTSTVWSTPLSTTGKHIHRVEHTSLNHWYAHASTVWSTPLSVTGMHVHPPCGAHLSQPLVCTSTVWSTPLSTTGMHIHRVEHTSLNHWYAHPPCGAHLSQPLVCTSTVWSTSLSATGMHIHRVEHTSLKY